MSFQHFSAQRIDQLFEVVVNQPILLRPDTRSALMADIDPRFVGTLLTSPVPAVQLRQDLASLNRVERLVDGSVPFVLWLRAAIQLAGSDEALLPLRRALQKLAREEEGEPGVPDATAALPVVGEAHVHDNDLLSYLFLLRGYEVGRAVCRLRVPQRKDGEPVHLSDGATPSIWAGSGWLMTPDLVVTNHHVVEARRVGETAADADFRAQGAATLIDFSYDQATVAAKEIRVTGVVASDPELDYAVLELERKQEEVEPVEMRVDPLEIEPGSGAMAVNVIQHPGGRPKEIAVRNNLLYDATPPSLRYFSDTERGSSGAPIFNDGWEVVGLHRGSQHVEGVSYNGRSTGVVNIGTQVGSLVQDLKRKWPAVADRIDVG